MFENLSLEWSLSLSALKVHRNSSSITKTAACQSHVVVFAKFTLNIFKVNNIQFMVVVLAMSIFVNFAILNGISKNCNNNQKTKFVTYVQFITII